MIKKSILPLFFESIIISLIIFTPLFYGSLTPLSLAAAQLITLLFMALLIIRFSFFNAGEIIYPSSAQFLFIFLALAIFQILPLPNFFIKIISPKTFFLHQTYMPYQIQEGFLSLAFYRLAAKREIIKFISFFIVFFGIINVIKKRSQFQRLFLMIIFWGLILSFYGLIKKYYFLNREVTSSFSSFGNRNHFAGYMVMVVPLAVGYSLYCQDKLEKVLFGLMAAIMSAAVFLSLSRAGSLSLIFSLLIMAALLKQERLMQNKYWIIIATIILGLILISLSGLEPIKHRFSYVGHSFLGRLAIAKSSLTIVKDFPLLGVGLGNFSYIFTHYKTIYSEVYFKYLHNDHLQLLVETGLVGFCFYFCFLYKIFRDILRQLKQRHDVFVKSVVWGGLAGLWGVLLHSFFEFNFHIPAIGFLFWLVLGLIYKCAYTNFHLPNSKHSQAV